MGAIRDSFFKCNRLLILPHTIPVYIFYTFTVLAGVKENYQILQRVF